jgi:hypothetical protein
MRRLPMPYDWYQHPSLPLNSQLLLNLMAEQEPSNSRAEVALISTPGLEDTGWTFGAGPVLAINSDMPGSVYAVSGTHAYRLNHPVGGATTITDLGSVGIAAWPGSGTYNVMPSRSPWVRSARLSACRHGLTPAPTAAPSTRSAAPSPARCRSRRWTGILSIHRPIQGTKFFCNLLLDPTAFNALDFAYADAQPNI